MLLQKVKKQEAAFRNKIATCKISAYDIAKVLI